MPKDAIAETALNHDVMSAITDDIKALTIDVGKYEADAQGKGIQLKLSGARYRIYETTIPE